MGKNQTEQPLTPEQQVELLQKVNEDLKIELHESKAKAEELQNSNLQLAQENEQIKAAYDNLQQELELVGEKAAKAPSAPVEVAPASVSTETFELEGAKYGFALSKLNFKGKVITAAEVLADAQLQQELVAMKSGMIKAL